MTSDRRSPSGTAVSMVTAPLLRVVRTAPFHEPGPEAEQGQDDERPDEHPVSASPGGPFHPRIVWLERRGADEHGVETDHEGHALPPGFVGHVDRRDTERRGVVDDDNLAVSDQHAVDAQLEVVTHTLAKGHPRCSCAARGTAGR